MHSTIVKVFSALLGTFIVGGFFLHGVFILVILQASITS